MVFGFGPGSIIGGLIHAWAQNQMVKKIKFV